MRKHILLLSFVFGVGVLHAQDTMRLTLDEAVQLARKVSVDALIAENQYKNAFWNYKAWQADRKPFMTLDGTLPRFDRTILAITQPDGSDLFIQRNQVSSSLNLSLSQEIGLTGGGQDNNLIYLSGVPHTKVPSADIIQKIVQLVEDKVKEKVN